MASSNFKRPELRLSGNIAENFKNFELRFHDYCIQADYRDVDKDEVTEQAEYYKKPVLEISALRSAMPDEALQVIRYTIEPQIGDPDKKKPWVWMEKLRTHYTGSVGSSLMTDRFKFWHSQQLPHESVQDWEVSVRQAGNLCSYGAVADHMCRDKFVFGLSDTNIRTELLKTHLKADNTTEKTMADVVSEAKTMEAAQRTNQLIIDTSKGLDEHVHWTNSRKKHSEMKLKRELNTCHWCGNVKGPHAWASCPAKGKTCSRCGGNDHFATVCLEPPKYQENQNRTNQHPGHRGRGRGGRGRGRGRSGQGQFLRQNNYQLMHNLSLQNQSTSDINQQNIQQQHPTTHTYQSPENNEETYYIDNYEYLQAPVYCLESASEANENHEVSKNRGSRYYANLQTSTNGTSFRPVKFQIDTAATCNTISAQVVKHLFSDACISKSPYLLFPYGNSKPLKPIGQINLLCERRKKYHTLTFQILPEHIMGNKPALLSGKDCEKMGLINIHADEVYSLEPQNRDNLPGYQLKTMSTINVDISDNSFPPKRPLKKADILSHFASNFSGVGCLQPPVSFKMKPDIPPIQMPIHRVPISKRTKEKAAIDRYVKEGILKKVQDPTPWCSNILCRESPSKFRVCIDPSQTINTAIQRPICQMPTLTEQLHKLDNAKCFSIIDVKDGYLHIPLDEESSHMTTMHTSYGRYRWTRLPFGISSAPEEFQIRLMTALEGLEGIALVADDILTFGVGETYLEAEADHDAKIIELMKRAQEKNIRFNPDKFQFKKTELKFVGHIITPEGIKADPDKVAAILDMEAPHDKASLLRFIGMVNFLSPYCANLSTTIRPLTELTKDGMAFLWSNTQNEAFLKAKSILANAPVLQYFSLGKSVTLQVDASENGLGGVLMQPNDSGKLQPVAYTSCSLTPTEKRYSQIEKECLAICNAFSKFDHWLYGKTPIEVHTDHKPLETIFKKPLNKAPARLQRMLMRLQRYQFNVIYKKGTSLYIADTLSRAALPQLSANEAATKFEVFRLEIQNQYPDHHPNLSKDTEYTLREETQKDPILQMLYTMIKQGWPDDRQQLPSELRPYWNHRDELSVNNGLIYKGHLTVIPTSMYKEMLLKIHSNHFGAESSIRMAKDVLFWHGIWKSIRDMCNSCPECAKYQSTAPKEQMRSLPIPTLPWQIISQDLFEYDQKPYLVTVCHFSDWIEVDALPNALSSTVIECTKAHTARYGIPEICHSDNGAQFISNEFDKFEAEYRFKHTKSSPYHPKGNGRAEAAVKVAKNMLKKSKDFHAAILNYRNTPQQGHSYSPVQRMMNHRTRTMLPTSNALLVSELVDTSRIHGEIERKRQKSKLIYDRNCITQHDEPDVGTYMYMQNLHHSRRASLGYTVK